jgi:NADH:ubiquinone oxidoreductase subunit
METPSSTLFVADLPFGLDEAQFAGVFRGTAGYLESRLRKDRNSNVIGYVEYDDAASAARVKESLSNYKFHPLADHGISIHFSPPRPNNSNTNNNKESRPRRSNQHNNAQDDRGAAQYRAAMAGTVDPLTAGAFFPSFPVGAHGLPAYPALGMGVGVPSIAPTVAPTMGLPENASSTLYVEGLPTDATEREVSHLFRQFPGFQSVRLTLKESKQYPNRQYVLCFIEFDNKAQATLAMQQWHGYRMDRNDSKAISISYAKSETRKDRAARSPGNPTTSTDNAAARPERKYA